MHGSRGPGSEATSFFGNIGSVESVVTEFNDNLFVEPEIENDIEIELEEEAVWKEEELRMPESVLEVSRLERVSMTAGLVAPLEDCVGQCDMRSHRSWGEVKLLKEKKTAVLSEVGQPMLEKEARTFYKIVMQSWNEKNSWREITNGTRHVYQSVLNLNVHGGFGGDDDGRTGRKKHVQELHWVHNPLVTSFVQGGGQRLPGCAANSSRDIPNIPHKGSTTLVYAIELSATAIPGSTLSVKCLSVHLDQLTTRENHHQLEYKFLIFASRRFVEIRECRWGWNRDCDGDCGVDCDCEKGDGITSRNKDNGQGRRVCLGRSSGVNEIVILSRAGYEPEEEDESSNEFEAEGSSRFRWLGRGSKSEVGVAPVNRIFFKISHVHRKVADGAPADCALENPITKSIQLAGREGTSFMPV
ncbi:hypothetical protein C8R41DRAFT_869645 [Lentinula lateritia]|uniref:Uncharacterized protein n=1 Tax=Lentinula lateritia TaxID=40482 RepID=A0ABQ8VAL3_9AGAR|nr:hypothetical protein C8R41DRAFT_869645 [Lentinula lateritia]